MARDLTYDEKKAAEAAFRGVPCDPKWSEAARTVYEGIIKALHAHAPTEMPQDQGFDGEGESERLAIAVESAPPGESEDNAMVPPPILNRDEAIQAGILIDVTHVAQQLGINLPVGISKPLWDIGITASHKLDDVEYTERVRDVLMALRLHLETTEVRSAWIKFPALLAFPPEASPQVCSLYAVAHKDPSAPYSLTLLLPHEMSTLNPSE